LATAEWRYGTTQLRLNIDERVYAVESDSGLELDKRSLDGVNAVVYQAWAKITDQPVDVAYARCGLYLAYRIRHFNERGGLVWVEEFYVYLCP
jgi:hypothetical protein